MTIRSRWKPAAALAGLAAAMAVFGGLVLPSFVANAPPEGLAPLEPAAVVAVDTRLWDAGPCPYGGSTSDDLRAET